MRIANHVGWSNKNKQRTCLDVDMSCLSLLFPFDDIELKSRFGQMDLEAIGIFVGEGTTAESVSGTLLYRGAAFDFALAAVTAPQADHHIFCDAGTGWVHSALTIKLGAAVASGQMVPAVVAALLSLGQKLGSVLTAKATFWSPAAVMSGFDFFSESVTQYDTGAAFPSLVCIGFDTSSNERISTTGLEWFCGQELIFERDALPVNEAMRYVVRLVHDMALNGAVEKTMDVAGMANDERLELAADDDPARLVVRRKHVQDGLNSAG
jgi:hypothetical protein